MKRPDHSKLTVVAGFFIALCACTCPANAQSSTIIYDVKFSEVFPQRAAEYRELIRQTRENLEIGIRQARSNAEQQQKIQKAREVMRELTWQIALECPPTTLVVHSPASGNDIDRAIAQLRSGTLQVGSRVTVRAPGSRQSSSYSPTPAADANKIPGYNARRLAAGRTVNSRTRVRPNQASNPKVQSTVQSQPVRKTQPNTPNFGGLIDASPNWSKDPKKVFQPGEGRWGVN